MLSLDGLSVGDEDSRVDLVAVDVDGLPLLPTAIRMTFGQRTDVTDNEGRNRSTLKNQPLIL